tara:strand:+ start:31 stop:846 length:816 start_codon:yes stop_codon:yes gene_type:complete
MGMLEDIRAKNKKKKEEAASKKLKPKDKQKSAFLGKLKLGGASTDIATEKRKGSIIPKKVTVKTKGGEYPVYKKKSSSAVGFRQAFAAARKARLAGKNSFTIDGQKFPLNKKGDFKLNNRLYNSMTADDNKKAAAKKASPKKPVKAKVIPKVVAAKEVIPKVIKPKSEAQVMALRRADDEKNYYKKSAGVEPRIKDRTKAVVGVKKSAPARYSSTVIARSGETPDAKGLAREKAMSNKLDGEMDAFRKRAAKRKSGGRICHGTRGYKPYNT